ncbi:MAG: hypothetical protein EOP09_20620 [Proteobacteria bacterium]|nr:MAG: hypothetical protein EOP09_20620 [Pseudomonadota bacterium]
MKRALLVLILMLACFSRSENADASGSNTVFLPVRLTDFKISLAKSDTYFNTSKLFDYLEYSQSRNVLVARVNAYLYRTTYYYTYWGYEMDLGFQSYETVTFKYYPKLGAIIGLTATEDLVVLLPEIITPSFGTGILKDHDK